jgi:hypothetical protein
MVSCRTQFAVAHLRTIIRLQERILERVYIEISYINTTLNYFLYHPSLEYLTSSLSNHKVEKQISRLKFDFIHFWSVTLVNTIKTTSFTPPMGLHGLLQG